MAETEFELSKCGEIERISEKAPAVRDPSDLFEPSRRTVALRDGHRAIQGHDRRRPDGHQRLVQGHNRVPIRLIGASRRRVQARDGGLNMIGGRLGSYCGELELPMALSDERRIPDRAIL